MPRFKDREEYERWKAERSLQGQKAPAPQGVKETGLPGPAAPKNKRRLFALIAALSVALLVALFFFTKGMFSSQSPAGKAASQPSNVVRPSNYNELLGVWSGSEIGGKSGWTFSFSDGYNIHVVDPEGRWYRGKAAIHWDLGADKDGMRVPPGAGVLDTDVTESSSGDYVGKTSIGAFAIYGGKTLKLCGGEPGKTKRPETFEPVSGIRCFELVKTGEAPPPPQGLAQSEQASDAASMEDDETRAARAAYKHCAELSRSGNMGAAKTCMSRDALAETEQSGRMDMAMRMITQMNIDEFRAYRAGNSITFKRSEKQGDATMSMSLAMVKEDNQWKLGNSKDVQPAQPSTQAAPAASGFSRSKQDPGISGEAIVVIDGKTEIYPLNSGFFSETRLKNPSRASLQFQAPAPEHSNARRIEITLDATRTGAHYADGNLLSGNFMSSDKIQIGSPTAHGLTASFRWVADGGQIYFPKPSCTIMISSAYSESTSGMLSGDVRDCTVHSAGIDHRISSVQFSVKGVSAR